MSEDKSELYGTDGADVLARWDRGDIIHTIEMGGLGPGYEQCIQIVAMEILRICLQEDYDAESWDNKDNWAKDRDQIEKLAHPRIDQLGLSGAQWGAGLSLGTGFYMRSPSDLLSQVDGDRRIMASRGFPKEAGAGGSLSPPPVNAEGP